MRNQIKVNLQKGYVALSMIILLTAVVMGISVTVAYLSIGEAQGGFALSQGESNLSLVEGCVEDLLQKVHDLGTYSGTSITRPEGTCTLTYTTAGPVNWDVTVTAAGPTGFSRKVEVIFTRGATIVMTQWKEI